MQIIYREYKNINPLFTDIDRLYTATSEKTMKHSLVMPRIDRSLKNVVDIFKEHGWEGDIQYHEKQREPIEMTFNDDKTIIVCFSGGKDSIAVVKHYLDKGYKVYLYHMRHINFALTDEYEIAQKFADNYHLPLFIDSIKMSGHNDYVEHPMKNMIIANGALQYGIREGITTHIAFGNYKTSTLQDDNFEYCAGDDKEMWQAYEHAIQTIIPGFKIHLVLNNLNDTLELVCHDRESKDILVELIRHRVPIHCGGMSDPFQKREFDYHLTQQLLELSNTYLYPIQFSTKIAGLPQEYLTLLNPDIHTFQISIIGWSNEYVRKWESNTPTAKERLEFVKILRDMGIFTSIRIQPIIDIVEVKKLLYNVGKEVDYYTVEHLKIVYDTELAKTSFLKLVDNKTDFDTIDHKVQVKKPIKIKNIKEIQEIANSFGVDVGVGDNDLHHMTQGRTCCGIDRIPAFQNYLKYNLTYMCTGEFDISTFIPQCNPRKHINDQKFGNIIDCKEYVDNYIKNHKDYLGPNRNVIEKELFGKVRRRLF